MYYVLKTSKHVDGASLTILVHGDEVDPSATVPKPSQPSGVRIGKNRWVGLVPLAYWWYTWGYPLY